jgi:Putative Flp pilus-assembly TadE/G-like
MSSSRESERGASAILIAMAMVVLMGFAAVAVDSGLGFDDRRQQQSAADVGALAAVQFARTGLPTSHPDCGGKSGADLAACRGAEEVLDVVDGTLPGRYSDAEWDACVDSSKPAEYVQQSFISDCISFTRNFQHARVVLPGSDVDTAFAKILGFDTIKVGAFAEADLDLDIVGGVLPFAVGPSGASSNQACFAAQSTANLDIEPCTASTEGNFGKLSLYLYGNGTYGTPEICSGGNASRMAVNIITGSDHPLEPASKTPGETVNDGLNCSLITNPVDQVETWTGNASGAITTGLFDGIASPDLEGRLLCKGGLSSDASREDYPLGNYNSLDCKQVNALHPEELDHTPLWDYIVPGATAEVSVGTCTPGGGLIIDRQEMEACIDAWKNYGPPHNLSLLSASIVESPRFGAVPLLDADPGNGFSAYNIIGFLPIYIETVYLKCNANSCDTVHSPGEASSGPCPTPLAPNDSSCGWSGGGNKSIAAISAFILSLDMLPPEIADRFPYRDGTITYNLHR